MARVLFGRQIRVEIDDGEVTITQPRISFSVERSVDEHAPRGTIEIYNLSPTREAKIRPRGQRVVLRADYSGDVRAPTRVALPRPPPPSTLGMLFDGRVSRVTRARHNLARITTLHVTDSVRDVATADSPLKRTYVTSRTLGGQTPVRDVVREIARVADVRIEGVDEIPADAIVSDWPLAGHVFGALTRVLRAVDPPCGWTEDNGVLRINCYGRVRRDARDIVVSSRTGLIGRPTVTDEGYVVETLLNPAIQIGGTLSVESEFVNGMYKVVWIRHTGDNWDGRFVSSVELRDPNAATN